MAVYFSDERRLDDADGFDVCDELLVGVVAGGGAARIVGLNLRVRGLTVCNSICGISVWD